MKKIIIVLAVFIVLIGIGGMYKFNYLSNKPGYDVDGNREMTIPSGTPDRNIAGADRDMHGCIGSAGYTWSTLRNECIRIFEAGKQYEAYGKNTDTTLAAYVIEHAEGKKVELFLPSMTKSVILNSGEQVEGDIAPTLFENTEENIKIIRSKDENYISQNGELIFVEVKIKEMNPSESYTATIAGNKIMFSIFLQEDGLSTFEFIEGTKTMTGNLNYERGLGTDENATIYVLNFDKPESEQKRFVKLSKTENIVFALNGEQVDQTYRLVSKSST